MAIDAEFLTDLAAKYGVGDKKSAGMRNDDFPPIFILVLLFLSPIIFIILLNVLIFELKLIWTLIGLAILISGCVVLYFTFTGFKREELITNTPTSKVRAMAMGRVELYGTAMPYEKKPMTTPFGDAPCIWCGWTVEWAIKSGEDREFHKAEGILPGFFYLKDETGQVLVFTKGSDGDGKYYKEYEYSRRFDDFIKRENMPLAGAGGKFIEYYIAPYEKVYVLGTARKNPTTL
jgi:hypothetical protein